MRSDDFYAHMADVEDAPVEWRLKRIEAILEKAELDVMKDRMQRLWSLTLWMIVTGIFLLCSIITGIVVALLTHLLGTK